MLGKPDAIAIVVGRQLGSPGPFELAHDTRLPERTVKIGAALAFVVFRVYLIVTGLA